MISGQQSGVLRLSTPNFASIRSVAVNSAVVKRSAKSATRYQAIENISFYVYNLAFVRACEKRWGRYRGGIAHSLRVSLSPLQVLIDRYRHAGRQQVGRQVGRYRRYR
jgi:hypothetical protein